MLRLRKLLNSNKDLHGILNQVFGYATFRGEQQQIIEQIIAGGNAFVLMPTGSGKSLCYQIPAIILDGVACLLYTSPSPRD